MIRQAYVGNIKIIDADAGAVQDKINLPQRCVAGVGRHIGQVGVFQCRRGEKKIQFPAAPEGIEVAGNDYFLVGLLDKIVQFFKLVLSVAVF